MEALFTFIIKSGSLIALFYFAYYFLLRKETFFTSNRYFLLAGLITSVILPFIIYTKVVWIDPAPIIYSPIVQTASLSHDYVSTYNQLPAVEEETFEINWNLVSLAIYAIGFATFMLKFAIDFYSLNSVLKGKNVKQQEDFKFVDVTENIAPFSYFDYIVYNSSLYSEAELQSILEHEKVHSDQHHTVDVIISRIFCILFWFNPIIWLYKKAILQNLEFIADKEASKKLSDKKAYQYTLLKITTHETCVAITNHFYQSLIKKRIVMLNKNQSKKWNYWKYYAVIPALAAFVFLFQIKTIAQEKKALAEKTVATQNQDPEVFKITKSTTDQELKDLATKLKSEHNVDVTISDLERNSKNEITGIKIQIIKENGKKQILQVNSSEAIKECNIVLNTNDNGTKNITLVNGETITTPTMVKTQNVVITDFKNSDDAPEAPDAPAPPSAPSAPGMVAPVPPVAPVFPAGPLPPAPAIDMSKMPKPPRAPRDPKDKVAMAQFEKEMEEFEKKMEKFQPNIDAMSAYGEEVEKIMSKREAIFEKQMEQYEIAMQKFSSNMDKFNIDMKMKFGNDSEYENNMKQYELDMRRYELDMKQHEKEMKEHAKQMKQHAKDMKQQEKNRKMAERDENRKA
ncbi:M56 family metallopeptidase [Flavobacterium sp. LHD-80]|uniref:M56 family metallopeptidase n=1 Tax=Flavobacterium sp. LHD-80 TaxID=3071411 RepID=UPI0027E11624|nr:M56 family metallopeptidase [Flavobacterium sp. LHD-80]MDQ6472972.1 M56 family metallopeptidase [Flavobacterium sp. LHD-80]